MKSTFYLIAFCLIFFTQCGDDESFSDDLSRLDEIQQVFIAEAITILKEIEKEENSDKNICISPLSIQIALMMTLNGAAGDTEMEIKKALGFENFTTAEINASYSELRGLLEDTQNGELQFSNAIFSDPQSIALDQDFENTMRKNYQAFVEELDFSSPAAVDDINSWAEQSTSGRIEKVLESIDDDEIMFLLNALFFKADWALPFVLDSTSDRPFTTSNGSSIAVPTMWQDAVFKYYLDDKLAALEMNFADNDYSMNFITTTGDENMDDLLTLFASNPGNLIDLTDSRLTEERVIVMLPKFEVTYHKEIQTELSQLGMPNAFSAGKANFSKFGEAGGNIFLTRVIHDSFLKIDEKGAEGAAVTTVGVGVTSVPPVLEFNRPFLFVLRHIETNAIVFIGIIQNPLLSD